MLVHDDATSKREALASIMPFVAAAAFAFATLPLPPRTEGSHVVEAAVAGVVAALSLTLGYVARVQSLGAWPRAFPPYMFLVAVALLRDAEGGAKSGFGMLVLLTLTSLAMNTGRLQLLVGVGLVGLTFVVPILALGPPEYPGSEWRRALLWVVVGGLTARTMQELVARVSREAKRAEALSRTDALTGLANRRQLFEVLGRELARAQRTAQPLALAMIDLDHFKRFNDDHGHAAGDRLLRDTASTWADLVRNTDLLARYGGEEFTLVLPDSDLPVARAAVDRLRAAAVGQPTCSIGMTAWRQDDTAESIIARADSALYQAKEAGRDRVVVDP